ncbi:hypothetical protein H4R18_002809 [Coemansia javaensis]|uniref:FAD-binding FR-type domain-containing protein n=1 Tax=Coemansia javaensis TaxID=2761396 RepID=A0A9W8HDZ3_9FUNG|nr:hypothetical protein H4R18_002809 [Coemansia javaensis]
MQQKQPPAGMPRRKFLLPPIYPCHYMLQRAGFMGAWLGAHATVLAYFIATNAATDWTQGLNLATQYGIVLSLMGILLAMSPTFVGMLRRTPLNRLVTFEKRIHAHKFMSYVLFIWTMAHSSLHYWTGVRYADSINEPRLTVFWKDRLSVTGQLMWMLFLFIGLAALPVVRRLYYEVFYYIHHLYLVNIVLLFVHSENGMAARYVSGPLAIFAADYLYRVVRSLPITSSRRARIRYIRFHPNDVVEVGFDRRELLQHTRIGQYVKLCVPELGIFQWHPFTITATPEETKIMADGRPHRIWKIHFKVSGDWTYRFSQRLHKVTAGGDAYTNNFDQEARIGRVVNDVVVPEVVPLQCRGDECEEAYMMAIAGRLDSGDSAVAVGAGPAPGEPAARAGAPPGPLSVSVAPPAPATPGSASTSCEITSPLETTGMCRVDIAPKKSEPDGSSFLSSDHSMDDNVWFVPGTETQAKLPAILVDGPYNAPMETFFEYHVNIIVAAGIGITPYIAALERVLSMCANNIPVRTVQTTREDLLPQKIYLVWVFRDISLLCLMLPALQRLRASPRARDIVVPCVYVTGSVDVEHESADSDVFGRPMLQLSNGIRLSKGRPPVARMVSYMAGRHRNVRMGVFCCAPRKLNALVRSSVHSTNAAVAHQGTTMEMRSECFSM